MAGVSSYAAAAAATGTGRPCVVQFGAPIRVSRTRLRRQKAGGGRFGLDSNSELQVAVKPSSGSKVEIELVATNKQGGSLALHWGALQPGRREWVLPPTLPEGTTRTHDDAALRTPFKSSGSNSTLKIEIDDPGLESIEFVVVDEAQNKWFKNNGENFQVQMRPSGHHHQGQQHYAPTGSIGRKNRDVMQLLSKNASTNDNVNKATSGTTPSNPTFVDLIMKSLQEKHGHQVLSKKVFKLNGKVPSWVSVPTSVALPFGTFETVLSDEINKEVAQKVHILTDKLNQGETGALNEIRNVLLNLKAPTYLVNELKEKMQGSGMPWPGDEGEHRWEQAWTAIKKVWASKWNERAYLSTRKVKLDHANLSMSVLVQEVVSADYAFVIHTINPSSGERSEIYAEVVKGLGETLVGAFPGRAMSFVCSKDNLDSPKVLGYPSKPIGLSIKKSIIFRSDSNGEDLEGYAGAGLYDSVPMDKEEEVVLDYTTDKLVTDSIFRQSILSSIARAGYEIEQLYGGSPQDIEGVVKDGKIYVVQTRPQM